MPKLSTGRYWTKFIFLAVSVIALTSGCQESELTNGNPFMLFEAERLSCAKNQYQQHSLPYQAAVDSLKVSADGFLHLTPPSVVHNHSTPPSGDDHDYFSMGPFWWPNPDTPNGLPYIRKDGYVNPERNEFDRTLMSKMAKSSFTLALSWFYTADEKYARKAVEILETWFLHPATRMNPNLNYGQAIPGITEGRGIGIIETGDFVDLVNGIEMLKNAEAMSLETYEGLKDWFEAYTLWLVSSKNGWDERMYHNNHGTSYDSQVASFALFAGMDSIASMVLDSVKVKRIDTQIASDGRQPFELKRTKAMSYSIKNARHLIENAILAEKMGIDLWNYQSPEGGSIMKTLKYLVPFYVEEKDFPYEQIGGIEKNAEDLLELLHISSLYVDSEFLKESINQFPVSLPDHSMMHLLYPKCEK